MRRDSAFHEPLDKSLDNRHVAITNENKPGSTPFPARPFLKWVGGKRSILPELLKRIPANYDAYHEPFMGGAALFFSLQPKKAHLSDVNFHLVVTFNAVKHNVEDVIQQLKVHRRLHNKTHYQKARRKLFKEKDPAKLAALFIYLNKTCFNGLYRVNSTGGFNVPMGDYINPPILNEDNLRNASKVLQGAAIQQHDFAQEEIHKNDFYYLDPPYH